MWSQLKSKFDERFEKEFPATFEAAQKGELNPHRDMSNAWWGFKEGYTSATPIGNPSLQIQPRLRLFRRYRSLLVSAAIGGVIGYLIPTLTSGL